MVTQSSAPLLPEQSPQSALVQPKKAEDRNMNITRKCRHCGTEYQYESFANVITFCPNCHKRDQLQCEYGYGPVVPCRIYLGEKIIGTVTYDDRAHTRYRFDAPKYNIHRVLEHTYMEALEEACDIAAGFISGSLEASQVQAAAAKEKTAEPDNKPKKSNEGKSSKTFKKENILLALACLLVVAGVIAPPSGSVALLEDFCTGMMFAVLWIYLFIRIKNAIKPIKNTVKIIVMTVCTIAVLWFSAMPILDMISGPSGTVLYDVHVEKTQGHTGIFSLHYYLIGESESGEKLRIEISGDEYDDFRRSLSGLDRVVSVEYYEHTRKLIRSRIL